MTELCSKTETPLHQVNISICGQGLHLFIPILCLCSIIKSGDIAHYHYDYYPDERLVVVVFTLYILNQTSQLTQPF